MMADLTAFLRARLDEDEQTARAAGGKYAGGLRWYEPDQRAHPGLVGDEHGQVVKHGGIPGIPEHAAHIARHDPARVLREVEAKRLLLDRHTPESRPFTGPDGCTHWTKFCPAEGRKWPCEDIRLIALPYADHPDYREEWRP